MSYLGLLFPKTNQWRLKLTRDQLMMLLAAVNLLSLGLETYLAHLISGTIVPREYIPIYFGFASGVILLAAGLIALRRRALATWLATIVLVSSIVVGLVGTYFHIIRAVLPSAPEGARVSLGLLVWAPPILAPLTFALVGLWGLSAAWIEKPVNSGVLQIGAGKTLRLPYSKTQAYLFMVSIGTLITLISSVLDHARSSFENPWLWVPVVAGVLGTVIPAGLAALTKPKQGDVAMHIVAMIVLIVVGVMGTAFHVQFDLTTEFVVVPERFIRGAPFLAPMLFANMGLFGLIAILPPEEG